MKRRLEMTLPARRDVAEIAEYIGRHSPRTADRFVRTVRDTCQALAETPGMGPRVGKRHVKLRDLRKWAIHGFLNYIVFYRVFDDYVEISRVLHGARNVYRILREES